MSVGATVVSNLSTDCLAPITRHFLYRPFLQELVLLGGVTVRLLKWFADVTQSVCLKVLYLGIVKKCYAVCGSVNG